MMITHSDFIHHYTMGNDGKMRTDCDLEITASVRFMSKWNNLRHPVTCPKCLDMARKRVTW